MRTVKVKIAEAVEQLEDILKKSKGNAELTSAKDNLVELKRLLGDKFELDDELSKLIDEGKQYTISILENNTVDTDDFCIWAKNLCAQVLSFENMCREHIKNAGKIIEISKSFIDGNRRTRQRVIIGFLITVIIISIIAAGAAIWGQIEGVPWGESLAGILGTVDFAIGMLGFSIERISDMKSQKVSSSLLEIERAKDLDNLKSATSKCKIALGWKVTQNEKVVGDVSNGANVFQNDGDVVMSSKDIVNCRIKIKETITAIELAEKKQDNKIELKCAKKSLIELDSLFVNKDSYKSK